jgi:ABC-2 type transport system ATP-binding protein
MGESPLKLDGLTKDYDSLRAVNEVSLEMEPGEVFGLLGPNGAGKTSIISILTTLERPSAGRALIFGQDVSRGQRETKTLLGCVPQEIVSHGFFSVEEVLRFHSGYYGLSHNQEHINFLLDRLGLQAHRKKRVRQLSGGMKRRLLIAKALVHQPRLLLLDEPTAGVDIELRNSLWEFVRELNSRGVAVLLTTHYLEEAESLCRRVGIIHHGCLLRVGETKGLVRQLTTREITFCVGDGLPVIQHPRLVLQEPGRLVFRVPNETHLGDLAREISLPIEKIRDIRIREGKLEDAFLNLVEEK